MQLRSQIIRLQLIWLLHFIAITTGQNALPQAPHCGLMLADRIYGGTETTIDEHPWMALLTYSTPDGRGFYCGGSLINTRWVLTAAHCVTGLKEDWTLVSVRLGEWNIDENPDCAGPSDCAPEFIDTRIDSIFVHPKFNNTAPTKGSDIALLRMEHDVAISQFVKPICLPRSTALRSRNLIGMRSLIVGWGRTEQNNKASPLKLKAMLEVRDLSVCNNVFKKHRFSVDDNQICAGGAEGVDSCNGDSGGPLIVEVKDGPFTAFYLVGITSFGMKTCGTLGVPGVYTRVTSYLDWIEGILAEHANTMSWRN